MVPTATRTCEGTDTLCRYCLTCGSAVSSKYTTDPDGISDGSARTKRSTSLVGLTHQGSASARRIPPHSSLGTAPNNRAKNPMIDTSWGGYRETPDQFKRIVIGDAGISSSGRRTRNRRPSRVGTAPAFGDNGNS